MVILGGGGYRPSGNFKGGYRPFWSFFFGGGGGYSPDHVQRFSSERSQKMSRIGPKPSSLGEGQTNFYRLQGGGVGNSLTKFKGVMIAVSIFRGAHAIFIYFRGDQHFLAFGRDIDLEST